MGVKSNLSLKKWPDQLVRYKGAETVKHHYGLSLTCVKKQYPWQRESRTEANHAWTRKRGGWICGQCSEREGDIGKDPETDLSS